MHVYYQLKLPQIAFENISLKFYQSHSRISSVVFFSARSFTSSFRIEKVPGFEPVLAAFMRVLLSADRPHLSGRDRLLTRGIRLGSQGPDRDRPALPPEGVEGVCQVSGHVPPPRRGEPSPLDLSLAAV